MAQLTPEIQASQGGVQVMLTSNGSAFFSSISNSTSIFPGKLPNLYASITALSADLKTRRIAYGKDAPETIKLSIEQITQSEGKTFKYYVKSGDILSSITTFSAEITVFQECNDGTWWAKWTWSYQFPMFLKTEAQEAAQNFSTIAYKTLVDLDKALA